MAGAHQPIEDIVKAVATGQATPPYTMAMLAEMNAKHAREFAGCTKAETAALHKQGALAAAATVRGLSDAQLDRSGVIMTGMAPMTVQQIVEGVLIGHLDEHRRSIRATVGD